MSTIAFSTHHVELLDEGALDVQQLAGGCGMSPEWVCLRVAAGTLHPVTGASASDWRFASVSLHRARRLAHIEITFDADPQLAALTTDLLEEVQRLRHQLARSAG